MALENLVAGAEVRGYRRMNVTPSKYGFQVSISQDGKSWKIGHGNTMVEAMAKACDFEVPKVRTVEPARRSRPVQAA